MINFLSLPKYLTFLCFRLFAGMLWLPSQTVRLKRLCMMP